MENFRTALAWAFGPQGERLVGQRLAAALLWAWVFLALVEGSRWVRTAQACADEDCPATVAAALDIVEAQLLLSLSQRKAALLPAERALARCRELGEPRETALAQRAVAAALLHVDNGAKARPLLEQAVNTFRALGERKATSYTLGSLGMLRASAGDLAGMRQLCSEALSIARDAGAERIESITASNLAEKEFCAGDIEVALRLSREACSLSRSLRDVGGLANDLTNQAAYLVALGSYDEAREAAHDALTAGRDTQYSIQNAFGLQHLAAIAALRQSPDRKLLEDRNRAARILGYVDARLVSLEALREDTEQQEYDAMLCALRDALGEEQLATLMAEGAAWSEDQAVADAMLV